MIPLDRSIRSPFSSIRSVSEETAALAHSIELSRTIFVPTEGDLAATSMEPTRVLVSLPIGGAGACFVLPITGATTTFLNR